jgi:hypothetical protein
MAIILELPAQLAQANRHVMCTSISGIDGCAQSRDKAILSNEKFI